MWIDLLHPGDPAGEMAAEIRYTRAVLTIRPGADAIVQNCLERIELGTPDIAMLVDHDAGNALACAARHDVRLRSVEGESLFIEDCLDRFVKGAETVREIRIAREGEIISISCVIRSRGAGQAVQPAIKRPGEKIG